MIKICFLNLNAYSIFNPKSRAPIGGAEVQLFNVAKYLSQDDNLRISFVTGDWGQKKIELFDKVEVIKSVKMKRNLWNFFIAPLRIFNILNKVNADIYIVSPAGAEVGIVAFFCKIKKKKLIVRTASSMECDWDFIKRKGMIGKMYHYGLKNADAVISQSENNDKLLKDFHNIESIVLRNSFFIKNLSLELKEDYILWVGKMETNKKPDLFLDLVRKMPNEKFLMISPKRNYQEDFADKIISEAKKIKNLTFIERVPYDKIQEYFNKAKIFICTSDYEGFPNVHLQACLGKTPIVTLNINPDNYINKYDVGYYANGDKNILLKKTNELVVNPDKLEIKAKNAYKYVCNKHDIRLIGEEWKKIIHKITS